jgi:hypothetical protein
MDKKEIESPKLTIRFLIWITGSLIVLFALIAHFVWRIFKQFAVTGLPLKPVFALSGNVHTSVEEKTRGCPVQALLGRGLRKSDMGGVFVLGSIFDVHTRPSRAWTRHPLVFWEFV